MKRLFFIFAAALLLVSCEEGYNTPQQGGKTDDTEYYVKYSIKSPGIYKYFSDIYYADVNGTKSTSIGYSLSNWSVTIGPVKKGFKASVRNEKGTGNNMIEISKNGGPFALKAEGQNGASYKINF